MMNFDNIVLGNLIINKIKNKNTEIYEENGEQYLHCMATAISTNGEEVLIDIPKVSLDWQCISIESNEVQKHSENNIIIDCCVKFLILEFEKTKTYFNIIVPDEEERLDVLLKNVQ